MRGEAKLFVGIVLPMWKVGSGCIPLSEAAALTSGSWLIQQQISKGFGNHFLPYQASWGFLLLNTGVLPHISVSFPWFCHFVCRLFINSLHSPLPGLLLLDKILTHMFLLYFLSNHSLSWKMTLNLEIRPTVNRIFFYCPMRSLLHWCTQGLPTGMYFVQLTVYYILEIPDLV